MPNLKKLTVIAHTLAHALATTTDAVLHYDRNVLIGDIHATIPAGSLRITATCPAPTS